MTSRSYTKSERPPGHHPEDRPLPEIDSRQAIITAAAPSQEAACGVRVHERPDPEPEPAGRKGKRRLPAAYGIVYEPCPGRGMFALTFRCPICQGVHFGRSAEPVASGPRRSRCGTIWLVIGDDCRADTADLMRAFGDGWRCGLEARAERGTAA